MEKSEGTDTQDASNDGGDTNQASNNNNADTLGISRRASIGLAELFGGRRPSGFAELEQAMNEVERVKRQRMVTDLLLPAMKIDETLEDVVGHLKRVFGGGP